jgi:hypothetical protein
MYSVNGNLPALRLLLVPLEAVEHELASWFEIAWYIPGLMIFAEAGIRVGTVPSVE